MKFEIKDIRSRLVIFSIETESMKLAVETAVKSNVALSYADLSYTNLSDVNLSYTDLSCANLSYTNLSYANLSHVNLSYANLSRADLSRANLYCANLFRANLSGANLSHVNLSHAYLYDINLSRAYLYNANLSFSYFPSLKTLSSINLGNLPNDITLELMRRDCAGHPYPEMFDAWAKGGACTYQDEERYWVFNEKRDVWKKGKPQMTDRDLILAICKAKKWGIKGHLKI